MKKITYSLITIFALVIVFNGVYAFDLGEIFSQGSGFFSGNTQSELGDDIKGAMGGIEDAVKTIGGLIFLSIGALLGVKYIWAGSDGKSKIKETLPTYLVGFALFYLGNEIYGILAGGMTGLIGGSLESATGSLWKTLAVIVNILAIAGIIVTGLRYMYSDSMDKAKIKESAGPMIIGLFLVYAITNILPFIYDAMSGALS